MLKQVKLATTQLIHNPTARVILILSTLIAAAMVGAAPSDFGGVP